MARIVDDEGFDGAAEVWGTPQYMSPEQARGLPADARSDLFSLGCVMYAMCTGRSPFRGSSTADILRRVGADMPRPIHEVNRDIPPSLVDIITRLLAKRPDDRFQTAGEATVVLERLYHRLQNPPSSSVEIPISPAEPLLAPAISPKSHRPFWVIISLLIAFLILVAAAVWKFAV
jgi:serine/threonine protein kinase